MKTYLCTDSPSAPARTRLALDWNKTRSALPRFNGFGPLLLLLALLTAASAPCATAAPTRSTPIAIFGTNLLVGVNPDANSVSIFDAEPVTPVKLAEVAVGRDPSSVAISPNGQTAYVANAADGTVSIIDLMNRCNSFTSFQGIAARKMPLPLSAVEVLCSASSLIQMVPAPGPPLPSLA